MRAWQRRARLAIGVAAIAFAIFVAFQFKRRTAAAPTPPAVRTEPGVVAETTGGRIGHFELSHENAEIRYDKQITYTDGSSKFVGVTIVTAEKNGDGSFTATSKQATISKDQTTVVLDGDVKVTSASTRARTEHATYTKADNTIRAPGPTEVTEGATTASGMGMTFERERDVVTILDQAVVRMADENGAGRTEITCGTAVFNRRERNRRFERNVRMERGGQTLEADTVVATLSEDEKRVEIVELRENARITTPNPAVGALQAVAGRNVSLKYAADGQSLEHALIDQDASIQLAGERGQAGRQIVARVIDVTLAPDGTPIVLMARENVQLTMPAEADGPSRTIRASLLDAKGERGRGLSRAQFTGNVQYREVGVGAGRAAASGSLDVGLKPGLSAIEDARFAHGVRFEQGNMVAQSAAARYDVDNGALELSGSEPGAAAPHVVTDRITADAQKMDVVLDGPKVKASANVKSVLQPPKKDQKSGTVENDVKLPSMLKQDAPVNVLANGLDYDGTKSVATYTGEARLFQGETSVKADSITIDSRSGDLSASGNVTSATLLQQNVTAKEHDKKSEPAKERVRSIASAKEMKYEDADRRLTYSGGAHLSNRDGDMQAEKIVLYLKPSGDELDRAEAYDALTLKEQNRKTTGARMVYTADDEQYVVTGSPVAIVDECGRETIGKTLTFLKSTDRIVVDGNQQIRTVTKNGGKCTS